MSSLDIHHDNQRREFWGLTGLVNSCQEVKDVIRQRRAADDDKKFVFSNRLESPNRQILASQFSFNKD